MMTALKGQRDVLTGAFCVYGHHQISCKGTAGISPSTKTALLLDMLGMTGRC